MDYERLKLPFSSSFFLFCLFDGVSEAVLSAPGLWDAPHYPLSLGGGVTFHSLG